MDQGWLTVVVLSATGAVLTLRTLVDTANTLEGAVKYYRKARDAANRAIIKSSIYSRKKSSRFINFFWFLLTGHPIIGPDDEPPPPKPGGGRKVRPGPIATVGYGGESPALVVRPLGGDGDDGNDFILGGMRFCLA